MGEIQGRIGKYRWTICTLVFFATTINYLDRQVIAILKPFLEADLGIGEADYGYIMGAFTFAYGIGMLLAGRIIDKLGTKIGYALSLFLWSVAAMAHAFTRGAIGLSIMRGFLGVSEAGNFPAAVKTVAEWFPKKERALATGIFNSGTNIGAILAPLTVPFMATQWGWQWAFIITGAIGLLWLIFWFIFYEVPEKQKRLSKPELDHILSDNEIVKTQAVPWLKLLKYRQAYVFVIGKFLTDPVWWFFLFWIPSWLHDVRGIQVKEGKFGISLALIYTAASFGSIFGGWLSSFLIKKGVSLFKARSFSLLFFACLVVPVMMVQSAGIGLWGAIALISIAAASHQGWAANLFTVVSDMFPKRAVATLIGMGGFAGAMSGMLISGIAGNVLEYWKAKESIQTGYWIIFIYAAGAYLVTWILMNLVAPRFKQVDLDADDLNTEK
jgi:MFS transporter, ACS family, hexuronate transporter